MGILRNMDILIVFFPLLAMCLFMYLDIRSQRGMSELEKAIHNGG